MLAGKFKELNLNLNEHINWLGGSTALKSHKQIMANLYQHFTVTGY